MAGMLREVIVQTHPDLSDCIVEEMNETKVIAFRLKFNEDSKNSRLEGLVLLSSSEHGLVAFMPKAEGFKYFQSILPDSHRYIEIEGEKFDITNPPIGKEAYYWVQMNFLDHCMTQDIGFTTNDGQFDILLHLTESYTEQVQGLCEAMPVAIAIEERYQERHSKAQQ